jgi:hypothetical protein
MPAPAVCFGMSVDGETQSPESAQMRRSVCRSIGALFFACVFCGCAEAPSPSTPWQGWGTNIRTGKQEWFFANYASLQDCQFRTKTISLTQPNLYREPSGCLYDGYQNPYVQWLVNLVAAYGKFKCIARLTDRPTPNYKEPVTSTGPCSVIAPPKAATIGIV